MKYLYFTETDNAELYIPAQQLKQLMNDFELDDKDVGEITNTSPRAARGWRAGERKLTGPAAALLLARTGIRHLPPTLEKRVNKKEDV